MNDKRGINPQHLYDHVIKPACIIVDGYVRREVADLMLGTCAQESMMGRFLQQHNSGPAHGIFQMEEPAYNDVWENYLKYKPELKQQILVVFGGVDAVNYHRLTADMLFAAVMCRLDYKREPQAIPKDNILGLANYWKAYWNSKKGKGTPEEFITNFQIYVLSKVKY